MRWMLALAMLATVALVAPGPVAAADVTISVTTWSSGAWAPPPQRYGHHHGPAKKLILVPSPVYVVPSRCLAAGYWNHAWVPQISSYSLWVDGAWSPDGYWIEGHYEQRLSSSGYWQPYWVEGRWGAC